MKNTFTKTSLRLMALLLIMMAAPQMKAQERTAQQQMQASSDIMQFDVQKFNNTLQGVIFISQLYNDGRFDVQPAGERYVFNIALKKGGNVENTVNNLYNKAISNFATMDKMALGAACKDAKAAMPEELYYNIKTFYAVGKPIAGGSKSGIVNDNPLPGNEGTGSAMKFYRTTTVGAYPDIYGGTNNHYDVQGIHNGNTIKTSYTNCGYHGVLKIDDGDNIVTNIENLGQVYEYNGIQVKQNVTLIDNGLVVKFGYTLCNNTNDIKTVRIGNFTDVQIGDNDGAAVYLTDGRQKISMTDTHSGTGCTSAGLKYNITADESTPFNGAWIGVYYYADDNVFYETSSTEDESVTDTDSGCAFHWKKTLQPGQTTSVWCYFEIAPALVIEAVNLTADAQTKKVHFDIPYKDLPNTTQTLYYTLEGKPEKTVAGNTNGFTPDGEGFAHTSFTFYSDIIDWQPNTMRTINLHATDNRGYTSKYYTFNVWWPEYKPESTYSTVYFKNTAQHFAAVHGEVGHIITLPSDSDEGRTFTGWNTQLDGKGTSYAAGANYTIPAEDSHLYAQWMISVDKLSVTANDQEYTGSAVETVSVKYGSTTLTAGVDYDIQYQNNVNVGQASATIGGSKLEGTKTVYFNILRRMLTVTITPNGGTYDGTVTPATAVFNELVSGDEVIPVLTYTGTSYDEQETVNGTTPPTNAHAGEYTVTATLPETTAANNYLLDVTTSTSTDFVIAKANNSWTTEPSVASVPRGTEVIPVSVAKYGEATVVYYGVNGTSYGPFAIKPTAAGYYKATFSIAETCNYLRIDADAQFTIYVAEVSVGTEVTGYYPTVQEAINEAGDDNTVTLVADVTENIVIDDKKITLDLNGKTLTSNGSDPAITVNGNELTITDSTEEPGVTGGVTGNIAINGGGTTTINNGKYNGTITKNGEGTTVSVTGGKYSQDPTQFLDITHVAKPIGEEPYKYEVVNDPDLIVCNDGTHSFTSLKHAIEFNNGKSENVSITLSKNTNEDPITIASDQDITLDLNGKTITSNEGETVITNNGTLTVIESDEDKAGTITGASTGAGIDNKGTLNLYAGNITGNATGVDNNGTLTLGGTTKITDNFTEGEKNNLYMRDGTIFTIATDDHAPAETMLVGITTQTAPSSGNDITLTGKNGEDYKEHFFGDDSRYSVINTENNVLKLTNEVKIFISANPSDGGEVQLLVTATGEPVADPEHILYGTGVTITATPSGDYAFAGWYDKDSGLLFSRKPTCTFDATRDFNLEARFTDQVIWVRVKKGN